MAVYYPPQEQSASAGDILLVPPFGEEMNRCRAMVAMQARALSEFGFGTLVLDPRGTGDSSGEFCDAAWTGWRDDLQQGIDWLGRAAHGCVAVWGIRLGAIMAAELAVRNPAITRLLLWQPVVNGKNYFTQFLRIRIAAEMETRGGVRSTDELRARSAAGEMVEVSGYLVGPELARSIDEARFPDAATLSSTKISWFEVVASTEIVPPNFRTVDEYRAKAVAIEREAVIGPPFWQLHERTLTPSLLEATTKCVSAWGTSASAAADSHAPADAPMPLASPAVDAREYPIVCRCESDELVAVLHRADPSARRGIVIVVAGGPQYRAGAHRQFVSLARRLSARGYPVLRFDLRGMGDSGGTHLGYQHSAPDIRAAIDALVRHQPSVDQVVLFGECESASGILFYAYRDVRVKGIALVNPWVRTEEGQAKVIVKHYYPQRLVSAAFWRKVLSGQWNMKESLRSLYGVLRASSGIGRPRATGAESDDFAALPLPVKTATGLSRFTGPAIILMSGRDYIAREFDEVARSSDLWRGLLAQPRICRRLLEDADHTFSREVWKVQVADWLADWLRGW